MIRAVKVICAKGLENFFRIH